MSEQLKLQARNCLTNFCAYPRTAATQLVGRMQAGEIEKIVQAGSPADVAAADKQKAIEKILDAVQKRWEKEADSQAQAEMKRNQVEAAANRATHGTPNPPTAPVEEETADDADKADDTDGSEAAAPSGPEASPTKKAPRKKAAKKSK